MLSGQRFHSLVSSGLPILMALLSDDSNSSPILRFLPLYSYKHNNFAVKHAQNMAQQSSFNASTQLSTDAMHSLYKHCTIIERSQCVLCMPRNFMLADMKQTIKGIWRKAASHLVMLLRIELSHQTECSHPITTVLQRHCSHHFNLPLSHHIPLQSVDDPLHSVSLHITCSVSMSWYWCCKFVSILWRTWFYTRNGIPCEKRA